MIEKFNAKAYDMRKENVQGIDMDLAQNDLKIELEMLKQFKPDIFITTKSVGDVAAEIGVQLGIKEIQYFLAGYYANFGLLSVEKIGQEARILTEGERSVIQMHTITSSTFLKNKQLDIASELVYFHHEYPNGQGYLKKQKLKNYASYYIHIADIFVGSIREKSYRPAYNRDMAINWALKSFKDMSEFDDNDISKIINILEKIKLPELGIGR